MVMYNSKVRRTSASFFAPDAGGSGGSSDSSGQTQNGGGQQAAAPTIDPKLFDEIPMAELDDDTKKVIEKIKTAAIATSQRATELEGKVTQLDGQARRFQSEFDRANAELAKLAPKTTPEDDPIYKVVADNLKSSGYNDAEVKKLAPTFVGMFKGFGDVQRASLGKDLQPLVGNVLAQQATSAFQEAQANDPLEMLKIPEVANETWEIIRKRASEGKENNAEIVLNFAKMVWADHQLASRKGGKRNNNILPVTPPGMNTGFNYPGAGAISSIAPIPPNPNAPRTVMNEDTREAVATSVRHMLKGFEDKIKMPAEIADTGKRRR